MTPRPPSALAAEFSAIIDLLCREIAAHLGGRVLAWLLAPLLRRRLRGIEDALTAALHAVERGDTAPPRAIAGKRRRVRAGRAAPSRARRQMAVPAKAGKPQSRRVVAPHPPLPPTTRRPERLPRPAAPCRACGPPAVPLRGRRRRRLP